MKVNSLEPVHTYGYNIHERRYTKEIDSGQKFLVENAVDTFLIQPADQSRNVERLDQQTNANIGGSQAQ